MTQKSQCHEFFLCLCRPAKSHPGLPSRRRSAARAAPALALWLTSKPKLSLPERSEQRPPRCHLHRREWCQVRGQGEAAGSKPSRHPAPAPHPFRDQAGYQPLTAATVRPVPLCLAHRTLLVSSAQTSLKRFSQAMKSTKVISPIVVKRFQIHQLNPLLQRDQKTHHQPDRPPGPAPASLQTTRWSLSFCRAKRSRWSRFFQNRCQRWT